MRLTRPDPKGDLLTGAEFGSAVPPKVTPKPRNGAESSIRAGRAKLVTWFDVLQRTPADGGRQTLDQEVAGSIPAPPARSRTVDLGRRACGAAFAVRGRLPTANPKPSVTPFVSASQVPDREQAHRTQHDRSNRGSAPLSARPQESKKPACRRAESERVQPRVRPPPRLILRPRPSPRRVFHRACPNRLLVGCWLLTPTPTRATPSLVRGVEASGRYARRDDVRA